MDGESYPPNQMVGHYNIDVTGFVGMKVILLPYQPLLFPTNTPTTLIHV